MKNEQGHFSDPKKLEAARALLGSLHRENIPEFTGNETFDELLRIYEKILAAGLELPAGLRERLFELAIRGPSLEVYFERSEQHLEKAEQRVTSLATRIIDLGRRAPEKALELLDRLILTKHKITKFAAICAVLFSLREAYNYGTTRYEVNELRDNRTGITRYEHEDKNTTHILNCITGLESLTKEEKTHLLKEFFIFKVTVKELQNLGIFAETEGPERIQGADYADLVGICKAYNEKKAQLPVKNDEELVDALLNVGPLKFDEKYYQAIWKIEKENGSPKIELQFGPANGIHRSHYRRDNTAVLIPAEEKGAGENFVAEASHARQFDRAPVQSTLQAIKDGYNVIAYMLLAHKPLTREEFRAAYDRNISMYHPQGEIQIRPSPILPEGGVRPYNLGRTIETEAHQEIEPLLREEFKRMTASEISDFSITKQIQTRVKEEAVKIQDAKKALVKK